MPTPTVLQFRHASSAFRGWIISEVNQPVYLPGHITHDVTVMPGDWIIGDNDEVHLIPAHLVDDVLPLDEVYRVFRVLSELAVSIQPSAVRNEPT